MSKKSGAGGVKEHGHGQSEASGWRHEAWGSVKERSPPAGHPRTLESEQLPGGGLRGSRLMRGHSSRPRPMRE